MSKSTRHFTNSDVCPSKPRAHRRPREDKYNEIVIVISDDSDSDDGIPKPPPREQTTPHNYANLPKVAGTMSKEEKGKGVDLPFTAIQGEECDGFEENDPEWDATWEDFYDSVRRMNGEAFTANRCKTDALNGLLKNQVRMMEEICQERRVRMQIVQELADMKRHVNFLHSVSVTAKKPLNPKPNRLLRFFDSPPRQHPTGACRKPN